MKLAEALILRADTQSRVHELTTRLNRVVKVQEGDTPVENPQDLLTELDRATDELETVIRRINRTNSATELENGVTITDALARRDVLMTKRSSLSQVVNTAAHQQNRYGNSEIRFVTTVDVAALQRQVDDLSRQYRELDAQIQQQNWLVDLIED
ncbi:MAG: DIP1984 family protein [Chloroflexota bacterium]